MRALEIDVDSLKKLSRLTRLEACEFAKSGIHVICRTSLREFQEVENFQELGSIIRLEEQGIYDRLEFYIN